MMAKMRLSIIIPTLNEQDVIGALLDDLAPLRACGDELILVDGGSNDATFTLAAGRVDRLIHSTPGRAVQMNAGAKVAHGDVLWFVHADSRVPADAAQRLRDAIHGSQAWGRFDVSLSGRQWSLRVIETLMNLRSRWTGIATGDQGIFVHRALFDVVGGYPSIPLMEDIELSRALRMRMPPACLRRPRLQTSSRRWEQRGILRTVLLMWRLRLQHALGTPAAKLARIYR